MPRRVHFTPSSSHTSHTPKLQPSQHTHPTNPMQHATHTLQSRYAPHPYTKNCHPKTLYVNYRRRHDSPAHPRLPMPKCIVVCACRSIPHVWGVFSANSHRAAMHTPHGPVLATDSSLTSFRTIHHRATVASAFDSATPLWIFAVEHARSSHHSAPNRRLSHHSHSRRGSRDKRDKRARRARRRRKYQRRHHRRRYRHHAPVVALCNIM